MLSGSARRSERGEFTTLGVAGIVTLLSSAALASLAGLAAMAEGSVGSDPFTWLVNLGVAGIVIVLLVTGQLRTKSEVDHLLEEGRKKDEVIEAVQKTLLEQTLPALARSTQVIENVPSSEKVLIDTLYETQRRTAELLDRMERLSVTEAKGRRDDRDDRNGRR